MNLTKFELIVNTLEQLLKPEYEGTSATEERFTIHFGLLPINDTLINIRNRSLDLLEKCFHRAVGTAQKRMVIDAVATGVEGSRTGKSNAQFDELLLNNAQRICNFYLKALKGEKDPEVIYRIGERVYFLRKKYYGELSKIFDEIESLISANERFQIYQNLVGYTSDFVYLDLPHEEAEKRRSQVTSRYINEIGSNSGAKWIPIITQISEKYGEAADPGRFFSFQTFLRELAVKKTKIVFDWMAKIPQLENSFLDVILDGASKSKAHGQQVKEMLGRYIGRGRGLEKLAGLARNEAIFGKGEVERIFRALKKSKNYAGLDLLVGELFKRKAGHDWIREIIVKAVQEIDSRHHSIWRMGIRHEKNGIVGKLNKGDVRIILKQLVKIDRITPIDESFLSVIAGRHPLEVVDFFEQRIIYSSKIEVLDLNYLSVPYRFYELNKSLKMTWVTKMPSLLKKLDSKDYRISNQAGRLIKNLLNIKSAELKKTVGKMIANKGNVNTKRALQILGQFQNTNGIFDLCLKIVKKHPNDRKIWNEVFSLIWKTGVVTGEEGFINAYMEKRKLLESYSKAATKAEIKFIKMAVSRLEEFELNERKRIDSAKQKKEYKKMLVEV